MNCEQVELAQRILQRGKWFAGLSAELQALILSRSVLRKVAKGEVLSRENGEPRGLFAVLEGQVAVTRDVGEGKTFFFYLGGQGFWFGEIAALSDIPTQITVTTRTAVTYLRLPTVNLKAILDSDPTSYRHFVNLMADRMAVTLRSLAQAHVLAPEGRLRRRLAEFCHMMLDEEALSGPIDLALSQFDLAQMIGCSRQTVNVLLRDLQDKGLIDVSFRKITVVRPGEFLNA